MDQKELCVAAKQRQGLTSDNQLALRLGVDRSRASKLVRGVSPADEAEIMMLADMAGIDPHKAFAAVHKDREKNPAKKAYWEKISIGFAMAGLAFALITTGVFVSPDATASNLPIRNLYVICCVANIFMGYLFYCFNSILPVEFQKK